jgi:outer membrane protein assembly factor BamB
MPDSTEAIVFYCPNCGSSVAMEGQSGICAYCGTAIERPKQAQPSSTAAWPPTLKPIQRAVRAGESMPRRGVRPFAVLVLITVAALGGFLVGRALPSGHAVAPGAGPGPILAATPEPPIVDISGGSITDLAAVLPIDGPGGDLIVYVYHSGDNNSSFYTVARIDGATREPRWHSPPLGKNAYQGMLAAGAGMVFLTDGDKLLALKQSDGALAWQAALDVEPQTACDDCLQVVGERVLVLEKNGGLQAFDTRSGQQAWSTRLPNTPRALPVVGGDRLLTLRDSDDKNGRLLAFLDAATGKPALELDPRCPKANDNFSDERPEWSTPFLFDEDGTAMYTMYGFFAKCAQGWDLAAGQTRWEIALDDRLVPSSWTSGRAMLAGETLYASNSGLLWALDTANGAIRTLADDKEYNLTPLAASDGMLIALASPTWDSQRKFLWGLDARTGEQRWQVRLQAREWIGMSSSGDFDFRLMPAGLMVMQVLRDDAKLLIETLDLRSGAAAGRQEHALVDMSMPGLRHVYWGDDTAWLQIDSDIFAIELATGTIAYRLT